MNAAPAAGEAAGYVQVYESILREILDRSPSGTLQRVATALGKNRSFVAQISNPPFSVPIPAQDVEIIFEVCRFRPEEKRAFIEAFTRAHPTQLKHLQSGSNLGTLKKFVSERMSLQALIDGVPDSLFVKDTNSRFVIANNATAFSYGRAYSGDLFGLTDFDLRAPEVAQQYFEIEQDIVRTGRPMVDLEEVIVDSAGRKRWLSTTKAPLHDEQNKVMGLIGIGRDVTARKLADILREGVAKILEMVATRAPLDAVLDHLMRLIESQMSGIFGSVLLLGDDGVRLRLGAAPSLPEAFTKATSGVPVRPEAGPGGAAAHRRETINVADIMRDPLWEGYRELAAAHGLRSCWSTPILSHRADVLGVAAMYSKSVREPTSAEIQLIDVAIRIAGIAIERKLDEDRIRFMANHCGLTGLPTRSLLTERLSQAMLYAQRYDRWVAVVFVDLDNFKFVNDSLGHNAGDQLLKLVAQRMAASVRATDTVLRLGGDEFVILLPDQPKAVETISATVQKIRAAIGEPIQLEGHSLRATSSLGVAVYPDDGANADSLLANADAAMYRAKESGRDNVQFYTGDLNTRVHEKFLRHEELRSAVARSEFFLLYQPQVDLRNGRIFAVEALIRWNHPTRGVISPTSFIPLAEETGLIVQIGDWVLRESFRQNKIWQNAGLPSLSVSVNVSARQFKERNLVSRVVNALQETRLEPKYLELELTESLIMQDVSHAVHAMEELQRLGVGIAIDDFGIGYSSLRALKTFPIGRLKIDKSFITQLPSSERDKAVTIAVISLAQRLSLKVIAEGVETDDQIAFLRANDCDEMQGFHFSGPVSAPEIEDLLKAIQAGT